MYPYISSCVKLSLVNIHHGLNILETLLKLKFHNYLPYGISDYFPILSLSLWNALSGGTEKKKKKKKKKKENVINQKSNFSIEEKILKAILLTRAEILHSIDDLSPHLKCILSRNKGTYQKRLKMGEISKL